MRTALRRPQRGRLLHADEHLALFLYVIDLLNSPAIAQRQYLVKHFFGNHGSARIKVNSLTHYKRRGSTLRQVALCLMPQRIASAGFLMFRPKSCRPLERNHIRLVVNNATRIAGGIPFDSKIALAILYALFLMAKQSAE